MSSDAGLRFFASIRTADGIEVHRATEDRLVFLDWLAAHVGPGVVVQSLTMEASGPAIPGMIAALKLGARRLSPPSEGET
jgi:hypothetical protein